MASFVACAKHVFGLLLILVAAGSSSRDDDSLRVHHPARGALLRLRHTVQYVDGHSHCHYAGPMFDAAGCYELTLGVRDPHQLLEAGRRAAGVIPSGGKAAKCQRRFHVMSLEEAETRQPHLKKCLVSTWAAKMYSELAANPCVEGSLERADLVVLPGYTAIECNWPIFGGGDCNNAKDDLVNFARAGSRCRDLDTLKAYLAIQKVLDVQVVILENSPNNQGKKYDLPNSSIYAEPNLSWAIVGADTEHYRVATDISVPPGPPIRCRLNRSTCSFEEGLQDKKFLATFKGSFASHPVRKQAQEKLHDGKQIIIVDTANDTWGFDDLLFGTVFSLILRGDAIMSYRFNEAICSGGIPVLVTDSWIPPFNETVPFETFGLIHDQNDLGSLRARLEGVDAEKRTKLREAAHEVCKNNFQTIEAHAASLGQAVSQLAKTNA